MGKNKNQLSIFEDKKWEKEWWEDDWEGMPEFNQDDTTPWHTLSIHFRNRKDMEDFAKFVSQTINKETKFIWYPKAEKVCRFEKMYFDKP